MSLVWTSWKLPISTKFHQKFHTPEDLIRGPRSNLDPTSDLDPTSHLDPTSTPTSTPSRLDLGLPHFPQRATGPLPPPLAPVRSSPTAQSRVPTSPSRRSALRPLQRPPSPSRPPRSRRPISLLTHDRYACRHLRISPTSGYGKPTGHHQLVHRVLLHNRSTVVLLRTYSAIP